MVEEGGQDRDEETEKVYIIRFIADLPLWLVYRMLTGTKLVVSI